MVYLFYIAVGIVMIMLVKYLIQRHRDQQFLRSHDTVVMIEKAGMACRQMDEKQKNYVIRRFVDEFKSEHKEVYRYLTLSSSVKVDHPDVMQFCGIYQDIEAYVKRSNKAYVTEQLLTHKNLLDNIDGKSLDEQQRLAVVTDEESNLVLAGAGGGKTLTISAKVKYLVECKGVLPAEILLISFTKKAAQEMQERIQTRLGLDVEVKTFHKLGLDILSQHRRRRPDIKESMTDVLDRYFKEEIYKEPQTIMNLITYFCYYLNLPKNYEEFESLGECHEYNRQMDLLTLKGKMELRQETRTGQKKLEREKWTLQGEKVKSIEEAMIANYLYLNGIEYEYERVYPYNTGDPYRKTYRPDFYLPDYDLYLEHFGVNEEGRAPWLEPVYEQQYLEGMKWKRELHRHHKTKLVETYSYYNQNSVLYIELDKLLTKEDVKRQPRDVVEIYRKVYDQNNDQYFREFKNLIMTFLGLFKSNGYQEKEFLSFHEAAARENTFLSQRSRLFFTIIKPIYALYEEELKQSGMIDFNDMINEAAAIVQRGEMPLPYRYIIIDEYQDISMSRYRLTKAIMEHCHAKLMCVGDDWQSIFRFAGSDLELFTHFEKYFGYFELLKIEKTYRNSQELIDVAGKFIMKNEVQYKKKLKSDKKLASPLRIEFFQKDQVDAVIDVIGTIVAEHGNQAEILLLGRNNRDIEILNDPAKFNVKRDSKGVVTVSCHIYPQCQLSFLTVHRSKGLEADNAIILNVRNHTIGFPNKIADDPLLSYVLTDKEPHPFAEERRLFYVAITRTRNKTYIMAPDHQASDFAVELEKDIAEDAAERIAGSIKENPPCPKCKTGYLMVRENSQSKTPFLGCSYYPQCDYSVNGLDVLENRVICPVCGGYMVVRKRGDGTDRFYGCTNFPICRKSLPIEAVEQKPAVGRYNIS